MVIVNGMPKSGTHAVMAWLTQLGLKRYPGTILPGPSGLEVVGGTLEEVKGLTDPSLFILAHVPADNWDLWGNVITIFRDPRNVLVSYVRYRKAREGLVLSLADALNDFWGLPFVRVYDAYLGWRGRSVVLRYEDLPPAQIGDGVTLYPSHQDWNTRTGSPSDWQSIWSGSTEGAWELAGGPGLLKRAGYSL